MPIRQSLSKSSKANAKSNKFSSYADEALAGTSLAKNKTTEFTSFTTNTYEEKSPSFLPKLEANHRYSNSQVQYRDEPQKAEEASFISDLMQERNLKSPKNSQWISNDAMHDTARKGTFSHDKRISQ